MELKKKEWKRLCGLGGKDGTEEEGIFGMDRRWTTDIKGTLRGPRGRKRCSQITFFSIFIDKLISIGKYVCAIQHFLSFYYKPTRSCSSSGWYMLQWYIHIVHLYFCVGRPFLFLRTKAVVLNMFSTLCSRMSLHFINIEMFTNTHIHTVIYTYTDIQIFTWTYIRIRR